MLDDVKPESVKSTDKLHTEYTLSQPSLLMESATAKAKYFIFFHSQHIPAIQTIMVICLVCQAKT
jgi:hypothetical protein